MFRKNFFGHARQRRWLRYLSKSNFWPCWLASFLRQVCDNVIYFKATRVLQSTSSTRYVTNSLSASFWLFQVLYVIHWNCIWERQRSQCRRPALLQYVVVAFPLYSVPVWDKTTYVPILPTVTRWHSWNGWTRWRRRQGLIRYSHFRAIVGCYSLEFALAAGVDIAWKHGNEVQGQQPSTS